MSHARSVALPPAPTERVTGLPMYVFAWLDELKADARGKGADLIDVGIGNPDQPTPPAIIQAIAAAYADPRTHGYPPFRGTSEFRQAVASFMSRRYGVEVDPEHEVICLSGGKEGIAHASMAFTDDDSATIVGDVHYPVHARATGLVGGTPHFIPLVEERAFLPDFDALERDIPAGARLLILNYPHNPTGALAPLSVYEDAVAFCRAHGLVLLSDLAYSELTFDGTQSPSALQVAGAKEVTLEFHSFSKSFNMAGSRIGFAVGSRDLIDALLAVRNNMGYGTPTAIQAGAAYALDHAEELTSGIAARYRARARRVVEIFRSRGWTVAEPRGSMFVWLRVPAGFSSQEWTRHLIDRAGIVVAPGNAFGPGGEGYFRVSLVAGDDKLAEMRVRLEKANITFSA